MRNFHSPIRPLLVLAAVALHAQTATQPPTTSPTAAPHKPRTPRPAQPLFNPNLIFLDPAHGGSDPGTTLIPGSLEKDANLAFAKALRDLLTPRGFTVVLTHESAATPVPPPPRPAPDPNNPDADQDQPSPPPFNPNANNPSLDARTEQANRSRAVACILIHATAAGHGVHIYTSALAPPYDQSRNQPDSDPANRPLTPWDSAQAPSLALSTRLASDIAGGLAGARIPLVTGHISTRPIDSMTCPAVTLELAPIGETPASDPAYQQRVVQSIAAALDTWRAHALPPAPPATQPTAPPPAPLTKPKTKPKPLVIPQENPVTTEPEATPPHKPAPIIRRPPPPETAPPPQERR